MPDFQLNIKKEHEAYSVGELIAKNFKISSRMLTKLKHNDGIKLNGEHITVRGRVKEGDVLEIYEVIEEKQNTYGIRTIVLISSIVKIIINSLTIATILIFLHTKKINKRKMLYHF